MASLRHSTTILTLSSGSALLLFLFQRYLPSRSARNIPRATHGHENSVAVAILNPQKQELFQHRITIDIPATQLRSGLDSDEILARFTQGFFGGWIFCPERWFFQITGLSVTNLNGELQYLAKCWNRLSGKGICHTDGLPRVLGFENVSLEESPIQEIWSLDALSKKVTPTSGSLLFGNFLLAEKVSDAAERRGTELLLPNSAPEGSRNFASAEFVAGGSKSFELISSHRFEVTREHGREDKERGDLVTVTFSHVSCNSVSGRPYSTFFRSLHLIYARLLFADGIRAILETK